MTVNDHEKDEKEDKIIPSKRLLTTMETPKRVQKEEILGKEHENIRLHFLKSVPLRDGSRTTTNTVTMACDTSFKEDMSITTITRKVRSAVADIIMITTMDIIMITTMDIIITIMQTRCLQAGVRSHLTNMRRQRLRVS